MSKAASAGDSLPPVDAPWHIARLPAGARLAGKIMALAYRLVGKHRYDDYRIEWVQGLPFLVIPSVFNPKVPRTGAFFASHLGEPTVEPEFEVLDLGTGCGVCAVFAARRARRVVAVDINEAAVRCASINAALNRVADRIDLRHGDLFAPVANQRFDLILFNPPFVKASPRNDRDRAWRSDDVAERFAAGLAAHLKPGGSALVVLSTFGSPNAFLAEFARREFGISVFAEQRFINERLTLFRLRPALAGPQPDAGSPA